jgi:hypothetical protein
MSSTTVVQFDFASNFDDLRTPQALTGDADRGVRQ